MPIRAESSKRRWQKDRRGFEDIKIENLLSDIGSGSFLSAAKCFRLDDNVKKNLIMGALT